MRVLFLFNFFLFPAFATFCQNNPMTLWYDKPAKEWVEALPIGNGRLGAMIYGTPGQEELQLNEETVWAGEPGNNINPETGKAIPVIRQMIREGQYEDAQKYADEHVKSLNQGMPYQPVGSLYLRFPGHETYTDYRRELDIGSAVARISYSSHGVNFKREMFASFPDQVIVVRLTADKAHSISCALSMTSPHAEHQIRVTNDNELVLEGRTGSHEGKNGAIEFITQTKVSVQNGQTARDSSGLQIMNADAVTLYISIATNFKNYRDISGNPGEIAAGYLNAALRKDYDAALQDHVSAYRKWFDRVTLDLGTTGSVALPTDVRLARFAEGIDPQLAVLYFQFGRYLLISSSQPGGQPATLQGNWNDKLMPPWDSKYTININTEMNYWPAEAANLSELTEPLLRMVGEIAVTGRQSAAQTYGARGWVTHHNTDLWRITDPVDGAYSWGLWPMGGAWLSQHLWQHFLYSGDRQFLEKTYQILKSACQFYIDVLQEEPEHHWLVVSPSDSPENTFTYGENKKASLSAGGTIDNQLVFDLFRHTADAAELLNGDRLFADTLKNTLRRLPPMQIGRYSQLQEWLHDWDNPDDKHRHVSHLYGLYPSNLISPWRTPQLFEAARNSLTYRGDVSTGWSMGWKVCLWARLLDGNHAIKLITDQLTPAGTASSGGTYPNLFDAHPPFQIDGNFGCAAGIIEMLMQSHDGSIYLLPALPDAWPSGKISGIKARGGFEIAMEWKNGKITRLEIRSALGGNCRLRLPNILKNESKQELKIAEGENPNPFYKTPDVPEPLISGQARLKGTDLVPTILVDLHTRAGETYILVQ